MPKFWKISAKKGDQAYAAYVATSDEAIQIDQQAEKSGGSLISYARHKRFSGEPSDDHRDLAAGALTYYATRAGMQITSPLSQTDSIPDGLKQDWIGGVPSSQTYAVIVHEQLAA